jgi:hypothetical protein
VQPHRRFTSATDFYKSHTAQILPTESVYGGTLTNITGNTLHAVGSYNQTMFVTQNRLRDVGKIAEAYYVAPTLLKVLTRLRAATFTLRAHQPKAQPTLRFTWRVGRAEGGIGIGEAPSSSNVISIQKNQAAFTEINIGNTNASGSSGIRLGSSVASGVFTSNSSSAIPSGGVGVVNTTGIYTDSTSLDISFGTGTNEQMRLDTGTGTVFINDTANANMTVGLDQSGANDNEILAFKSAVAHGYTSGAETDTTARLVREVRLAGERFSPLTQKMPP